MKERTYQTYSDFFYKVVNKTAGYTALTQDEVILVTTGSDADVTITLPTTVGRKGKYYIIQKIDGGTKTVIIDGHSSETINGAGTLALNAQYDVALIVSDGTNWQVITKTVTAPPPG